MKITVEKLLAKKIIDYIRNDLAALAALGNFELMLKSAYGKATMEGWNDIVAKFIKDAMDDNS
jgi:hypothetical protein